MRTTIEMWLTYDTYANLPLQIPKIRVMNTVVKLASYTIFMILLAVCKYVRIVASLKQY